MANDEQPITPYLTVDDATAAIEFYSRAFGAETAVVQRTPDGSRVIHATLLLNGGRIFLCDDFPEMNEGRKSTPKALGATTFSVHLELSDVDAAWKRALDAGATVKMPLADMFWGDRFGVLTDPFGHSWSLGQRIREPSARELDEGAKKYFG